jgi:hypothetical protein
MSIYDYTAAIKITFDKPIVNTPEATGWLIQSYQPSMSPGGPLVLTTHTIKRMYKSEDNLSVTILITLATRMRYPIGEVTVTFTGTLIGPYNSPVAPFVRTFTPTGIAPVFNPHDPEYLQANSNVTVSVYEVAYIYAKTTDEYLSANINNPSIVVTNVGGLPL